MLDDESTGDIRPEHTTSLDPAIQLRANPAQVDDAPAPRHRTRPESKLQLVVNDDPKSTRAKRPRAPDIYRELRGISDDHLPEWLGVGAIAGSV